MKSPFFLICLLVLWTGCDNSRRADIESASGSGDTAVTGVRRLAAFNCDVSAKEPLTISVLDSGSVETVWNLMAEGTTVYRVLVQSSSFTDTLVNILEPLPILVDDTLVAGLVLTGNGEEGKRELFRFHGGCRQSDRIPVPEDTHYVFHDVAISPDGKFFAYVASDSLGEYGVIRKFGSFEIVATTPGRGGCDCDVDLDHARWFSPDSFEIAVRLVDGGWQVSAGRASLGRMRVDTVALEPEWH